MNKTFTQSTQDYFAEIQKLNTNQKAAMRKVIGFGRKINSILVEDQFGDDFKTVRTFHDNGILVATIGPRGGIKNVSRVYL
jgi:hypothetical protein